MQTFLLSVPQKKSQLEAYSVGHFYARRTVC